MRAGGTLLALINEHPGSLQDRSGRIVLEEIDFELDGVLQARLKCYRCAPVRRLELAMKPSGNSQAPYGDPTRLREILVNLVSNAVKFTGKDECGFASSPIRTTARRVRCASRFPIPASGLPPGTGLDFRGLHIRGCLDISKLRGTGWALLFPSSWWS